MTNMLPLVKHTWQFIKILNNGTKFLLDHQKTFELFKVQSKFQCVPQKNVASPAILYTHHPKILKQGFMILYV